MNKFNPFYVIGTVGMIVSAVLHMVFALVLNLPVNMAFSVIYPVFMSFLAIGFGQILRVHKKA